MKGSSKKLAQNYEPWMLQAARDWINEGWSLNSFPGKHPVGSHTWIRLLRDQPELQTLKFEYREIRSKIDKVVYSKGLLQ